MLIVLQRSNVRYEKKDFGLWNSNSDFSRAMSNTMSRSDVFEWT
jgi:hypothetical protein